MTSTTLVCFAAPPSPLSIQLLTKVAVEYNLSMQHHLDMGAAFVHADLGCDIYMRLPSAFSENSEQAVHLNKSLYGLKKAGHMFSASFVDTVVGCGPEHCKTDPCAFRLTNDETVTLVVAVHVDGLFVVAGAKEAEFHEVPQSSTTP